jgi:transcription elongation GreA/GreB family factor
MLKMHWSTLFLIMDEQVIDKEELREKILDSLQDDYELQLHAAKAAHAAATHEECRPDNKYATLGLEASYLAQGQANRAQEILRAQQQFRQMVLPTFSSDALIRVAAVVELLDEEGQRRHVFIAPTAGGLEVNIAMVRVMVITPASPLGRELIGKRCGDLVRLATDVVREYEIEAVY